MQWKHVLAGLTVAAALLVALLSAGCSDDVPAAPEGDEGIRLQGFLTGFTQPVFVTHAGDGSGRLFIVEQGGLVKVWEGSNPATSSATTYLDLRDRVLSGGERGLLGLAFHPDFADNGRLFVYYTSNEPSQYGDIVIEEHQADAESQTVEADSGRTLLTIDHSRYSNHNGGMLAFGPDGYLYAGVGDGGSGGDPDNNAQDLDSLLGKILRLDVDNVVGTIPYLPAPPDDADEGRGEIWAYGLRNPWRFSFDRTTGDLWIGDVGQQNYEEVNLQRADANDRVNYGWSRFEGKHVYDSDRSAPGAVEPVAEYDHDGGHCAITGGYVYRGSGLPGLAGAYLFADYCSGVFWTLRGDDGDWEMRRVLDTQYSVSSFGEDEDGELYVVDRDGDVLKVVAA